MKTNKEEACEKMLRYAKKIANQQGFNVTHKYNSYGVKQIVITL